MLDEAKGFWDAIAGRIKGLIHSETKNAMRLERYDVTTAPNGTKMGVTKPFGSTELMLPYSQEVANATVGEPVLVAWWGSMSNAKVYYFANGYSGSQKSTDYTIYNSVADLGLTVGSATIVRAWSAMPINSILVAPSEEWASAEMPTTYGAVEICKQNTAARGWVIFHGRTEANGSFVMRTTSGAGAVPDGNWVRMAEVLDLGTFTSTAKTFALPTAGNYLIATTHASGAVSVGLWIYSTSGSTFFNIGGGSAITLTGSGTSFTAKSGGATVGICAMRLR